MISSAEYSEFLTSKEWLRTQAKDVPLLFMWAMDMLQEIERGLALIAILRKQVESLEQLGLSALDPELYSSSLESRVDAYFRKKDFKTKINAAVDEWPVDETLLVSKIKERHFQHLDSSKINSFKDVFHKCREIRNYLAHSFFTKHAIDKTTSSGVVEMEKELQSMLFDFNFVHNLTKTLVKAYSLGLNTCVEQLVNEQEQTEIN